MNWSSLLWPDDIQSCFPSKKRYSDHEVKGNLSKDDAPTIDISDDDDWKLDPTPVESIETNCGALEDPLHYVWRNSSGKRLEYIYHEDYGYVIAFGTEKVEKVLGSSFGHPWICTFDWSFRNSDGSTDEEDTLLNDPTPEEIAELFNEKAVKYLFNQKH